MGPTRTPYGRAWGYANQFYTNRGVSVAAGLQVAGTAGDISGQTAPDVTIGELFYTNNTGALTITNFLLQDTANRAANYEGKTIRIFFLDTATQVANSGTLFLSGTNNLIGANNQLELLFSRGNWFETDRVYVNRTEVNTYLLTGASSIGVDGVRLGLLNNTGSTTVNIIAFSGGQVGQELTLAKVGSNTVDILSGGNIFLAAGTNAIVMNASGAYKFIKIDSASWRAFEVV